MVTRRARGILAATATLATVAAVAIAATLADGRPASQSDTHDGGAWLLNRDAGAIGHVNRVAEEVTGTIRVSDLQAGFDVDQARGMVLVHDLSTSTATVIDDSTYSPSTTMAADRDLDLRAIDGGMIALANDPVSARRLSRENMEQGTSVADITPSLAGETSGIGTVDVGGKAVLVDNDGTLLHEVAGAGDELFEVVRTELEGLTARPAQLTVVGDTIVVLTEAGELLAVNDTVTELDPPDGLRAGDWTLQQPSGPGESVTAASPDGEVMTVDLREGGITNVIDLDGGLPLEPIVHGGCTYGVSTQPTMFTRVCGEKVLRDPLEGTGRSTGELRLRLVNGWVWVNDVDSGTAWVTDTEADLVRIDDWTAALAQDDGEPTEETATDGPADERRESPDDAEVVAELDPLDLDGPNEPPIARPDTAATRDGRPVVVDVLANDTDPNGDVLLISSVDNRSTDRAVVTVTGDRTAVQVVPQVGVTGTVRFSYTITDGRGGSDSAEVTVDVTPLDPERNRPPTPVTDAATVRAGDSVTINVLTNDSDPDGDSLHLVDVTGEGVSIQHAPDGTVTLTPDPDQEGRLELAYTVADEFDATATGRILLEVRLPDSNRPPQARNDTAQTVVGNRIVLDVLANDSDPDGDRLIVQSQPDLLSGPDGADAFVALDARGRLDFEADAAGTYVLLYSISDGSLTDSALIRIEVAEGDQNRPPVAMRDDVTVPVGSTRVVPVLRNDTDPDGDVLSIVDWSGAEGLVIEELEGDRFRVTALSTAAPLTTFRYSISDGINEPVGGLVAVMVVDAETNPPPPVAVEDEVEVRAGQVTTIPVLDNDYDPTGSALRVVGVTEPDDITASVSGDGQQVRIQVPDGTTSGFTLGYEVENDNGDRASTTVRVRIVPADEPNRAPIAGTDIARTVAGRTVVIDVLSNDRDPDGDPIQLEGIARQPANGTAQIVEGDRIAYTPDDDVAGTDRFAYTIADAGGLRAIGEVLVGVNPPWPENRPPQAQDDTAEVVAGGGVLPIDVLANDHDPDGDPLTVVSAGDVRLGRVQIATDGRSVVYTPPERVDEDVEVAFRYVIDDGRGGQDEAVATVTVKLDPHALPPIAVDDRVGPVAPGETVAIDVLANDRAPGGSVDDLELTVDDPTLQVVGQQVRLTAPDTTGTYLYTITSPAGLSASATITVQVQENRPPVVEPFDTETQHETPIEVDLTGQATDPDDDDLIFVCCDTVRNGSARVSSSDARSLVVVFQPDDGFAGRAGFSYTVDDQQGHQVAGSATIEVAPPSSIPPVAVDGDFEVEAGGSRSVDLTGLVDHPSPREQLSYGLGSASGPVSVDRSGATLRIEAAIDAAGSTARVPYTVTNEAGEQDSGTITIEITSTSAPLPQARTDQARTTQGEPVVLPVLNNDVGEGLFVVSASGSGSIDATVVESGTAVLVTPSSQFFGTASASYTIRDAFDDPSREQTGRIEVAIIGRPGVAAAPSVTADSRQATLTWSPPASNGAPIEAYELQHDQGGDQTLDPTSAHTWTALTNGTTYRFRVRAVNEAGAGEWSPWSTSVTPNEVPGRPAAPSVRFGDGELEVSWQRPSNDGSPITSYVLEIGGATTGVRELPAGGGPAQSYTWTGLANGANHTFRVKAVNDADEAGGDFSSWSEPEHPLTRPDAPARPTLEGGPNYLDVSWSRPDDGGDAVQEYEVQIDASSGRSIRVSGANTTNYRWGELTNGVQHRFRVRAWNRDTRGGEWSAFSDLGKACDVPGAPATPTVERGDLSATVRWSAPATNGCDILGYDVTFDGGTSVRTAGASSSSVVVDGLTNGTEYRFQVRARNDQGEGSWSAPSAVVVPAGEPKPTTINWVEPSAPEELEANWAAADPNGAPILRYELRVDSGPPRDVGQATTYAWGGLEPGQNYSFQVRAVNEIGASPWSPAVTETAEGEAEITSLTSSAPSRGTLRWNWNATGNGAPLLGYEVQRRGGSTSTTSSTSHVWENLPDSTTREVRVRARNWWGWGPWSSYVAGTTQAAPPPPPPSISVSISKARDATGQPGCTVAACRWIQTNISGMSASQGFRLRCQERIDSGSAWSTFWDSNYQANGSGNYTGEHCYYGFVGRQVRVVITPNGGSAVGSNIITW